MRARLLLNFAAVALWLVTIYLFTIVAPWTAAMAPEKVPEEERAAVLNAKWVAVVDSHGKLKEWRRGTVAQRPAAFTAHVVALLACGTTAFLLARRARKKG